MTEKIRSDREHLGFDSHSSISRPSPPVGFRHPKIRIITASAVNNEANTIEALIY